MLSDTGTNVKSRSPSYNLEHTEQPGYASTCYCITLHAVICRTKEYTVLYCENHAWVQP